MLSEAISIEYVYWYNHFIHSLEQEWKTWINTIIYFSGCSQNLTGKKTNMLLSSNVVFWYWEHARQSSEKHLESVQVY